MAETVDIHALAGAYALDAVDELERKAFERHLRDCPSCRAEVEELKETASWLSHPLVATPPPGLRDAVLARVARTPQEARSRPAAGRSAPQTGWRRWTVAAVAAGIIGIGAGTGTWVVAQERLGAERTANAQMEAVLSAPDAKLVRTTATGGGLITIVVSPSRDAAVAILRGLQQPDDKHAYQLWMVPTVAGHPTPVSVGLLPAGAGGGRAYIKGLRGASTFAVSQERAKGATTPNQNAIAGQVPF